jgi:hypothetical protein
VRIDDIKNVLTNVHVEPAEDGADGRVGLEDGKVAGGDEHPVFGVLST